MGFIDWNYYFYRYFFRYTPNRTLELLKKFKGSIWNKIIPNWIIVIMPLIVFLLGLILCKIFL